MFTNISWSTYSTIVTLLLTAYYLFIGFKFYGNELQQLLSNKIKLLKSYASPKDAIQVDENIVSQFQEAQPALFASHSKHTPPIEEADDTFKQVGELTTSLKEVIAVAVDKKYIKEEFVLSLQLLLKRYSFLKGSPFLVAINNLIASECEKYGYIQLSAEERVMLWNE